MLIARALGRPGVRVALAGVWDEAAIRGLPISFHSPTAGRKRFGDPSAARLEVLDPAQNTHFRDACVELPVDLSEVVFIATANDAAKIPDPLRDRLEIIEAPGYTDDEKIEIVRRALWRGRPKANGLVASGFWGRTAAARPRGRRAEAAGAAPAWGRPAAAGSKESTRSRRRRHFPRRPRRGRRRRAGSR